ncbi:MAG: hypothetical protein WC655_02360 [Candidatus Hydrogenedentales bacterium]|jgi:hypothetical protein
MKLVRVSGELENEPHFDVRKTYPIIPADAVPGLYPMKVTGKGMLGRMRYVKGEYPAAR